MTVPVYKATILMGHNTALHIAFFVSRVELDPRTVSLAIPLYVYFINSPIPN
jgi:hypothetical protein